MSAFLFWRDVVPLHTPIHRPAAAAEAARTYPHTATAVRGEDVPEIQPAVHAPRTPVEQRVEKNNPTTA